MPRLETIAAFLFAGGIGGASLDLLHVQRGVVRYASPDLLGQAWWVAALFGLGAVALGLVAYAIASRAGDRIPPPTPLGIILGIAFAVALYLASGTYESELGLAVAFAVVFALRVAPLAAWRQVTVFSVLPAVAFTGADAMLVSLGAIAFTAEPATIVPLWLPALYLNLGPLAFALVQMSIEREEVVAATAVRAA